jgi:hypothetical protein
MTGREKVVKLRKRRERTIFKMKKQEYKNKKSKTHKQQTLPSPE